MKTPLVAFIFSLLIAHACAQEASKNIKFTRLWETESGLKIPESVLYDSTSGVIYVSNIDGAPTAKDNKGFIATLSVEGKILNADWVTGLHAPKGMGIFDNHLYVSNIDEIVEIDIPTATITQRYAVEGAGFLNDVAVDPITGMIFITDTEKGQVYVLHNKKVALWLQGPLFEGANGLYIHGSQLFIGTSNSILEADIQTGMVKVSVPNTGSVDGLFYTSDKKFIYSNWKGSVFTAGVMQKSELIINTTALKVNAADFGIMVSKNRILIPTFGNNKVVCYTSPMIN